MVLRGRFSLGSLPTPDDGSVYLEGSRTDPTPQRAGPRGLVGPQFSATRSAGMSGQHAATSRHILRTPPWPRNMELVSSPSRSSSLESTSSPTVSVWSCARSAAFRRRPAFVGPNEASGVMLGEVWQQSHHGSERQVPAIFRRHTRQPLGERRDGQAVSELTSSRGTGKSCTIQTSQRGRRGSAEQTVEARGQNGACLIPSAEPSAVAGLRDKGRVLGPKRTWCGSAPLWHALEGFDDRPVARPAGRGAVFVVSHVLFAARVKGDLA